MLFESMDQTYDLANFHEPLALLRELESGCQYNLIVCDLIMEQMNGLAFVKAAHSYTRKTPILILSGINTSAPIAEMQRLGAAGFVHKSAENKTLTEAVQTILNGGQYYEDAQGYYNNEASAHNESLSEADDDYGKILEIPILGKRQIEVLRMIAQGASNKEISNTLDISPNTVKTHLRQIFEEMDVNKRTACVRKAQTFGII